MIRESGERWRAPMSLWRFYYLSVATFGIYVLFWYAGCLTDLRKNSRTKIRISLYVLFYFVPVINIIPFFFLARNINRASAERGLGQPIRPVLLSSLYLALPIAHSIAIANLDRQYAHLFVTLGAIAAWPALFIPLQAAMNRIKQAVDRREPTARSGSYRWTQRTAIAAGVTLWGMLGFGGVILYGELALSAGQQVAGDSGAYHLTVPGKGWSRGKPEVANGGVADLLLNNLSREAFVVVYVHGRNQSLDSLVSWRRNQIAQAASIVEIDEQRTFLSPEKLQTVSRAVYRTAFASETRNHLYQVRVVETDRGFVELIGFGPEGPVQDELVSLIDGLKMAPSAKNQRVAGK